ncbi:mitochondrial pyruvate carrier 2-like [Dendronephthya gigantea]|uniref:mitochondrial pyruvate carrier 2-like n=1 Tax=Dendronephthya gigantea TaxID=151771 RepID=UPI00106BEDC1|nr:mitochondrial pyruvate carrier 2-like [Dendronephthya gigantea]
MAAFRTKLLGILAKYDAQIQARLPRMGQKFWNSATGPKTIFFWAPTFKWGLVIAGIADLTRPAEKLSASQSLSLAATGFIWSRYSLVIIPRSWNLFGVNFFLGMTGLNQLYRVWDYQRKLKSSPETDMDNTSSSTT